MTEKIIIKSEHYKVAKMSTIIFLIGLVITLIWNIGGLSHSAASYEERTRTMSKYWSEERILDEYGTKGEYIFEHFYAGYYTCHADGAYSIIPLVGFSFVALIIYCGMRGYSLTVTDKRIYGNTWLGKRVDLPVDSISAISKVSAFKGIAVATSSGKIEFLLVKNANKVYEELNNLLVERQSHHSVQTQGEIINAETSFFNINELKKYKELLDAGIISQEEFDTKKKQLLNL